MEETTPLNTDRAVKLGYLMGVVTTLLVLTAILLFVGYRTGFEVMYQEFIKAIVPRAGHRQVVDLPGEVLEQLTSLRAVIDNAGNPTGISQHDTLLVQPDDELTYTLRPDANLSVYMLRTIMPYNLDPPVLILRKDAPVVPLVQRFIDQQSRLAYAYSTNGQGQRTTLPRTGAGKRLLVIGDSVAFGVGVDDDQTIASHLQRRFGNRLQVVNAGVGGYDGRQAYLMARRLSEHETYEGLVYVACQNDFMAADDWVAEAGTVLSMLEKLKDRFSNRITVILVTYMEYTLRDFFLDSQWSADKLDRSDTLRTAMNAISADKGFIFIDWTHIVDGYRERERSIFAPFALYVDHAHLSPAGSELAAKQVFTAYSEHWADE